MMFSLHRRVSLAIALAVGAVSLTGCYVGPAPYGGGGAYYSPAPVYVGPVYGYGPRYGYWHGGGGYWHGGGGWRR
jgi:hypothetical protein